MTKPTYDELLAAVRRVSEDSKCTGKETFECVFRRWDGHGDEPVCAVCECEWLAWCADEAGKEGAGKR